MPSSIYQQSNFAGYDQGVDYRGSGPIPALADAIITRVDAVSSWIGRGGKGTGAVISYRVASGPNKGRNVYVAENLTPLVNVGQTVKAGEPIATAQGQFPYTESGWADPSGSPIGRLGSSDQGRSFYDAFRLGGGGGDPSPSGGGGTADATSWGGWAAAFLERAGFPVSGNNLKFVVAWLHAENPSSAYAWNPLATTLKTSAATRPGGVQAYRDESSGLDATVQTIQGGQYAELRRQLAGSGTPQTSWDALRRSPWDAGHYASTPSPPFQVGDVQRSVVGAKKGGGGGLLGDVTGIPGDIWNLPGSVAGAVGGAAGDAAGAALGPVGDAISGATDAVVHEAESLFVRAAWIGLGLLMAGAAVVLIARTVGATPPMLPAGGKVGGAAGAAGGAAESAAGAAEGAAGSVAELAAA